MTETGKLFLIEIRLGPDTPTLVLHVQGRFSILHHETRPCLGELNATGVKSLSVSFRAADFD